MNDIGKPERATQNRVVKLFCDELGYRYLGNWADRAGNSNIDAVVLCAAIEDVLTHPSGTVIPAAWGCLP